ncbi:Uma2 family endonuclease [Prochlorothrix hollandica]|uniref:Uma2 family endonuclease n=1 Tax=Prochlorothrix hollandica TaxID=1223 RepID=UPI00034669E7|nr:Uma2 family endonuclease [Prochlorothrix hollandica]
MIAHLDTTLYPAPTPVPHPEIVYPDSDGEPMADNTKQFRWITVIQYNLEWLFAPDPTVFVAGDLLWYPVEGNNKIRQAPDVMVAFGAGKGDRGSYQQWKEGNVVPQVVFEILSPGNTLAEMNRKQAFYNRYGVEEYYIYDPDRNDFSGWVRTEADLEVLESTASWVSPRLGIRFEWSEAALHLYRPDGAPFASYGEVSHRLELALVAVEQERQRADQAQQNAAQAQQQADQERQRAEQERQRADRLAQQLKSLGINLDETR